MITAGNAAVPLSPRGSSSGGTRRERGRSTLSARLCTSARTFLPLLLLVIVISKIPVYFRQWRGAVVNRERQRVGTAGMVCEHVTWEERRRKIASSVIPHDEMVAGGCEDIGLLGPGPRKCHLAIVNAGMPRSGSTLVNSLITEAIEQLNVTSHYKGSIYWQQHIRRAFSRPGRNATDKCRMIRERYEADRAMLASLTKNDIILVKSHEFDATLLDLCHRVVVISSTRDLADIVFSKIRLGWFKLDNEGSFEAAVEQMVYSVHGAVQEHNCWQRYAPRMLQLLYEDISHHYGAAVMKIMGAILDTLPTHAIPPMTMLNISAVNAKFSHTEGNPWQRATHVEKVATVNSSQRLFRPRPHHKTATYNERLLSPQMAGKIREAYASFQSAHGYLVNGQRVVVNAPRTPVYSDSSQVPESWWRQGGPVVSVASLQPRTDPTLPQQAEMNPRSNTAATESNHVSHRGRRFSDPPPAHSQRTLATQSTEEKAPLALVNPPEIETVIEDYKFLRQRDKRREMLLLQRQAEDAERQQNSERSIAWDLSVL